MATVTIELFEYALLINHRDGLTVIFPERDHALVMPAARGVRGAIDTSSEGRARAGTSNAPPLVFERFKAQWEVFSPAGAHPGAWADVPALTPCPNSPTDAASLILSSFSQLEDVWQVKGVHAFDGPLVAQNGSVVRYATAYNETAFNAIAAPPGLYLAMNLGKPQPANSLPAVQLPFQSIAVKSAWMILKNDNPATASDKRRYRWRQAWVRDLEKEDACTLEDVALVGLHIMQKTRNNPQWIWSSFEHVDNLRPADSPGATPPHAFHDGKSPKGSMPSANPNVKDGAMKQPPAPFVVERKVRLHLKTMGTTKAYVAALPDQSVWRHYRLVMTQWPRSAHMPTQATNSIPGGPVTPTTTSFANPVFETFFQNPQGTSVFGCMQCHARARDSSDYLWSPRMHAFAPPGSAAFRERSAALGRFADQLERVRTRRRAPNKPIK